MTPPGSFDELCDRSIPLVETLLNTRSRAWGVEVNPALDDRLIDAAWNPSSHRIEVSRRVHDALVGAIEGRTVALMQARPMRSMREAQRAGYAAQALLTALIKSLEEPPRDPLARFDRDQLVEAATASMLPQFVSDLGLDALDPRVHQVTPSPAEMERVMATMSRIQGLARAMGEQPSTVLVRQLTGRRYTTASSGAH